MLQAVSLWQALAKRTLHNQSNTFVQPALSRNAYIYKARKPHISSELFSLTCRCGLMARPATSRVEWKTLWELHAVSGLARGRTQAPGAKRRRETESESCAATFVGYRIPLGTSAKHSEPAGFRIQKSYSMLLESLNCRIWYPRLRTGL